MKRIIERLLRIINFKRNHKKSYSQCGEDIIVDFILSAIGIKKPKYLDIGAHNPVSLNNTYLFYKKGYSGVNIEPDPLLFKKLISKRHRDINLNVGAAVKEGTLDFFVMTTSMLNTFHRETAERYESYGNQKIEKILKVKVLNVNDIVRKYFKPKPNYVSLDAEGLDLEILKGFDFECFRPEVICVETLTYTEDNSEQKINEIIEFMCSSDYFVYADTYINTIFVDRDTWTNRSQN